MKNYMVILVRRTFRQSPSICGLTSNTPRGLRARTPLLKELCQPRHAHILIPASRLLSPSTQIPSLPITILEKPLLPPEKGKVSFKFKKH